MASNNDGRSQRRPRPPDDDTAPIDRNRQDVVERAGQPAQGTPGPQGTLASGYSSRSSTGGTPGDVLQQRGSGYSPGADSRVGPHPEETDPLAREGVAAGAAGVGNEPPASHEETREGDDGTEDYDASDGSRAVGGVAGTSGGGRGTTPATNSRK